MASVLIALAALAGTGMQFVLSVQQLVAAEQDAAPAGGSATPSCRPST